jgi:hypothetical protein
MTPFHRLNHIMPFVIMLYLLASLAQTHVTRPVSSFPNFAQMPAAFFGKIETGARWYAGKVGDAEAMASIASP